MSFRGTTIALALVTVAAATAAPAGESRPVDTVALQAAIASFGVPVAQSEKAAAAAAEEIARKRRDTDGKASRTVSQVPDDLLDISPY